MKIELKVDGKNVNVDAYLIEKSEKDNVVKYEIYTKKDELCKTWEEYEKRFVPLLFRMFPIAKYYAAYKLELLRDHYNGGSEMNHNTIIYNFGNNNPRVTQVNSDDNYFLNFKSYELAEQFLENFRDLIIEAEDLI